MRCHELLVRNIPAVLLSASTGRKPGWRRSVFLCRTKHPVFQTGGEKPRSRGARVAILARVGRPPAEMPEGMHFTHVSFAVYSQITTFNGRIVPGYAIYNEYQSNEKPDTSSLVQDFPVDFFAGVATLEAGVIIPSPELQKRLLQTIASPTTKNCTTRTIPPLPTPTRWAARIAPSTRWM